MCDAAAVVVFVVVLVFPTWLTERAARSVRGRLQPPTPPRFTQSRGDKTRLAGAARANRHRVSLAQPAPGVALLTWPLVRGLTRPTLLCFLAWVTCPLLPRGRWADGACSPRSLRLALLWPFCSRSPAAMIPRRLRRRWPHSPARAPDSFGVGIVACRIHINRSMLVSAPSCFSGEACCLGTRSRPRQGPSRRGRVGRKHRSLDYDSTAHRDTPQPERFRSTAGSRSPRREWARRAWRRPPPCRRSS